jgi:hypothetical protein
VRRYFKSQNNLLVKTHICKHTHTHTQLCTQRFDEMKQRVFQSFTKLRTWGSYAVGGKFEINVNNCFDI